MFTKNPNETFLFKPKEYSFLKNIMENEHFTRTLIECKENHKLFENIDQ